MNQCLVLLCKACSFLLALCWYCSRAARCSWLPRRRRTTRICETQRIAAFLLEPTVLSDSKQHSCETQRIAAFLLELTVPRDSKQHSCETQRIAFLFEPTVLSHSKQHGYETQRIAAFLLELTVLRDSKQHSCETQRIAFLLELTVLRGVDYQVLEWVGLCHPSCMDSSESERDHETLQRINCLCSCFAEVLRIAAVSPACWGCLNSDQHF